MRKKIAAFRPQNVLERSMEKANRYGFDFFGFPIFELVERKEALKEIEDVFEEGVDIVVFTSLNGVKKSFSICEGEIDLKKNLSAVNLAAIGPVTKKELEKRGVRVDFMPEEYSAKGLMRLLEDRSRIEIENKKIVFLRSSEGTQDILDFLRGKGASVKDIPVYKVKIKDSEDEKELFLELFTYKPDYIVFTSSLTFKTFLTLTRKFGLEEKIFVVLKHAKIVAIGDLTAETIREEGMKVDLVAGKSTFEDVLKEIKG
ncbi:MAG: uroporphyrinogen-III synthase [Methanophagales archaeon]|nr:uroporphyrinogen-III synthase [Methanophagales archaeon]MCW3141360.1 uroporphyrinogen-III synthase [Methanophagales archaeon]